MLFSLSLRGLFLGELYLNFHLELTSQTAWCHRVKKNQLDAQLLPSIFRQPLHVSGVSRPIIRRYDRMYTTIGTYCSERWIVLNYMSVYTYHKMCKM